MLPWQEYGQVMRKERFIWRFVFGIVVLTMLACGPIASRDITPTPTKTPKRLQNLATLTPTTTVVIPATAVPVEELPPDTSVTADTPVTTDPSAPVTDPATDTPVPEAVTEDTPTSEPEPATDTPEPAAAPTNTPVPPPPPTNTPVPPPPAPTNTPAPPPPPANTGPTVIIELPNGDTYAIGEEVRLIITVRDSDGVNSFSWGVFTENQVGVAGGNQDCGNATECRIEETFTAALPGAFQIGVEAKDATGIGVIEVGQLYVG